MRKTKKAKIAEIFSSVQGEGLWVGCPQVFVRFHGCGLECAYCDTRQAQSSAAFSRIEYPPFSGKFKKHSLEFSAEEMSSLVGRYGVSSLALTGGEPLEQSDFICCWLERLDKKYTVLLETGGVEVEGLKKVISLVDMVSLDVKIPSATGGATLWDIHDRFIRIAQKKPCCAKVVYDENMTTVEMAELNRLMQKYRAVTFIFQPVSPIRKRDLSRCLEIFGFFSHFFPDRVRFIPQMHKFLRLL